jgi:hypothetical protein
MNSSAFQANASDFFLMEEAQDWTLQPPHRLNKLTERSRES